MPIQRIKKSIKSSIKDGACWATMFGFVEPYIVPFALSLGSNNFFIGIIRSLPIILSAFAQIFTEFLVFYFRSCKKVVFWAVFIQAFSLFLSALCSLYKNYISLYFFLIFIILYSISGSIATAPWYTLIGEYLPSDKRGKFFGFRYRIIAISYFSASFIASLILNYYGKHLISFFFIFITASFFRFCSTYYISLMYEPKNRFHIPKTLSWIFSHNDNTKKIEKNIYKIFLAIFILMLSTYIAAPYFSVYILKELKFDYIRYMILMSIGQFLTWILMKNWGTILDKKGTISVIKYAFYFIPLISFLWTLNKNFYYLLAIETFSGISWSAFGLSISNIVYEYIEPSLRTRYNSYLIFLMSLAQFIGSLIGGFLYDNLSLNYKQPFLIILIISTIGRFLALIYFNAIRKDLPKQGKKDLLIGTFGY